MFCNGMILSMYVQLNKQICKNSVFYSNLLIQAKPSLQPTRYALDAKKKPGTSKIIF